MPPKTVPTPNLFRATVKAARAGKAKPVIKARPAPLVLRRSTRRSK